MVIRVYFYFDFTFRKFFYMFLKKNNTLILWRTSPLIMSIFYYIYFLT